MLREGLEHGDLKRLVHPEIHIDEFQSKLGKDEDICVISFKVGGKEPGKDLVNFIEKGYDWVVDADVSPGEMDDGDFLVFIEAERDKSLPENFMKLVNDLMNLTEQKVEDWRLRYRRNGQDLPASAENFAKITPLDAKEYNKRYGKEDIDKLKAAAGVKVDTKAPKNDMTEALRIAAGIR
jgi:hypothetical protein